MVWHCAGMETLYDQEIAHEWVTLRGGEIVDGVVLVVVESLSRGMFDSWTMPANVDSTCLWDQVCGRGWSREGAENFAHHGELTKTGLRRRGLVLGTSDCVRGSVIVAKKRRNGTLEFGTVATRFVL